jgi:putative two-component system response regulator
MLGAAAGVSPEEREILHYGGLFHDIGKISIRDDVLLKPGKLTPEERKEIQRHPVAGRDLLRNMRTLDSAMPIVYHHHERYDGSGYPEGLVGDSIPLLARVASIADVYDALTTKRPYRDAMTRAEALEVMGSETKKGWHDAGLFDLFLGVIEARPEGFLPGGEEA